VKGAAWCRRHSDVVDAWLHELFAAAGGDRREVALVAIGGYGRAELCPASDIDVMLLHDRRVDASSFAPSVWYPIWDAGWHLGHSVCTVRAALRLASDDLDTATALLSARHVAGDASLTDELASRARTQWQQAGRRWLAALAQRVEERHATAGEVGFEVEPDLKNGRGGMRDVHALRWAEHAHAVLFDGDDDALAPAYDTLLAARVELQRATGRSSNVLTHQEQTTVAAALGYRDTDDLLHRLSDAARTIAWTSDDTWRRVRATLAGPRGRSSSVREVGHGVVVRDGELHADGDLSDPVQVLRVGALAASLDVPIDRATLEALARHGAPFAARWPAEGRALLEQLLLAGRPTIAVVEAFDQRGLWERFVPEWSNVRARPQHDPYHRFTVDRHLLETVANVSSSHRSVARRGLVAVAALVHDLGKGSGQDHTAAGVALAAAITERLGYAPDERALVQRLVQHHLLLADVASRRDIGDPVTVARVADAVGSVDVLHALALLTEADSMATGPAAWTPWKARLVEQLVTAVEHHLRGDAVIVPAGAAWPNDDDVRALRARGRGVDVEGDVVTVVTDDRPGVFSRVAGALALRGLDVLEATAHSTDDGLALQRFRVLDAVRDETPWPDVVDDVMRALDGRIALEARLAERARAYARGGAAPTAAHVTVTFDDDASTDATVIDVHATDGIGVLYRITRALADLDLDIRAAKVQTMGARVVDAFYVRDRTGAKVTDTAVRAEIERAIVHNLCRTLWM